MQPETGKERQDRQEARESEATSTGFSRSEEELLFGDFSILHFIDTYLFHVVPVAILHSSIDAHRAGKVIAADQGVGNAAAM